MLVLTRKKNDSIVIDGRITVEVLQVKGGGIRLGITAPADVSILRGELKPFGVEGDGRRPAEDDSPDAAQVERDLSGSDIAAADSLTHDPLRQALSRDPSRPRSDRNERSKIPAIFNRRWRSA